ncbi:hypothetical protein GW17_00051062 [Ensete ventricosum]|nr:hypothetical protein GW17_00051062 [Ensete ventricosum]RZS21948.1 hypothetical protein BHM03_00054662 [Ensete ventricosum]
MHRVDVIGNSPGVHRELTEGIGSLLGWRKGVRRRPRLTGRLLGVIEKLVGKTGRLTARKSKAAGLAGMCHCSQDRKAYKKGRKYGAMVDLRSNTTKCPCAIG